MRKIPSDDDNISKEKQMACELYVWYTEVSIF